MSTDPMLDVSEAYSINKFTANGVQTVFEINFAGGYIRPEHVKAYSTSPADVNATLTLAWIGPNTVSISPAVTSGYIITIYRDTPKDSPVVDFTDGAIINELNLDALAKQATFVSAEMLDRFSVVDDKGEAAIALATQANANAQSAIDIAQATIGGDFTLFARTNVSNTFATFQTVPALSVSDSSLKIANTAFVQSVVATAAAAAQAAAISAAATDASTKASAAQAAAIAAAATDATSKAAAAQVAAVAQAQVAPSITGGLMVTGGATTTGGTRYSVVAMTAATAIDVSAADFQTKTITGNTTFTITGAVAATAQGVLLELTITSGTPTFPGSVTWDGGTPGWTAGKWLLGFISLNGGTAWTGKVVAFS